MEYSIVHLFSIGYSGGICTCGLHLSLPQIQPWENHAWWWSRFKEPTSHYWWRIHHQITFHHRSAGDLFTFPANSPFMCAFVLLIIALCDPFFLSIGIGYAVLCAVSLSFCLGRRVELLLETLHISIT